MNTLAKHFTAARSITQFRADPLVTAAIAVLAAGFLAGALAGIAATLYFVPLARTVAAPDPIAAIILSDEAARRSAAAHA